MPSNYAKITEDNVRRRGEDFDDIGKFLAEQFYSDQTHFIYELLQNAQDALKRRSIAEPGISFPNSVSFSLYPDRLELRHFGQPFDENDVKGISNILKTTKNADKKQIGRFGIGFKSVYAFTESPEIHSGDEHFVIERYIRPRTANPIKLASGETLFIFPFNHTEKNANETFERIKSRLGDLGLRTLLFLDEIDQIVWDLSGKQAGAYIRDKRDIESDICKVILFGEEGQNTTEENWLIFQKPVNDLKSNVEIAFYLDHDQKTNHDYIRPLNQSKLFAYFKTDKETHLQFLIQGHYQTTPSRDNVLEYDEFNQTLIAETAILLVKSLEKLKSMGLLNAITLEAMPLNESYFPVDDFFRPIFEEFRKAMMTMDLLPAMDNHFVKAEEAKLARSTELIQLLSADSLKALFGFSKSYRWLSGDITRDKTPRLREFLMGELNVEEIDPEKFARHITKEFLEYQSDSWIIKFYEFLGSQRALWRQKSTWEREGILRHVPIIRTEEDEMVVPFDEMGNPLVFLPVESETQFLTVKRSIFEDKSAANFLNNFGLCEPDLVDEIQKFILPKYQNENLEISNEENLEDIRKINRALENAFVTKRELLVNILKNTPLILARNQGDGSRAYRKPAEIYIDDEDLRCYFENNPEIWFYDISYFAHKEILEIMGCSRSIRMKNHNKKMNYKNIKDWTGSHERGIDGFDSRWEVDGLAFAIQNPTINRSMYIWEHILRSNSHLVYGVVERSTRQDYSGSYSFETASIAGKIVRGGEWLPDKEGVFRIPAELSLDDLPDGFFKDEELAKKLGMKEVRIRDFASEKGIDETALSLAIEWIQADPDAFKRLASKTLQKSVNDASNEKFNYLDSLQKTFEKPDDIFPEPEEGQDSSAVSVQNPVRRRQKVQEEIMISILNQIESNQRFRRVPSIVWETKDNRVRTFLFEEYHGRCQICDATFNKRSGIPYFEGLYLVSRNNGQWIDRPGNVLCLCPTCCAKFQHGQVVTEEVVEQILHCKLSKEGGDGHPGILLELCGETVELRFTERHMLDLQEMIKASEKERNSLLMNDET